MEPTVSLMPYLQSENCTRKTFFANAEGRAIKINIFDATNSTMQQGGIATLATVFVLRQQQEVTQKRLGRGWSRQSLWRVRGGVQMHSDRILMSSGADPIQQLLTKQLFSDIRHPISISASDDNARKDTLSTNHTKFNSLRLHLTVSGIFFSRIRRDYLKYIWKCPNQRKRRLERRFSVRQDKTYI